MGCRPVRKQNAECPAWILAGVRAVREEATKRQNIPKNEDDLRQRGLRSIYINVEF